MSDNVGITPGTGATVAADNISDVLYQRVKVAVGADGEAADLDHGQAAMAASLPVVLASDQTDVKVTLDGESVAVTSTQLPAALAAGGGLPIEGVAGGVAVPTEDTWTPTVVADVTDDDSDKTLTVPASTIWQPLALHVTLTTTADVGDRQLAVLFTDGSDNVLAEVRPQVVQAASLARKYSFALGNPDDLAFYDTDLLRTPLPVMVLPAGYKIRVYDNNAVAAAADDLHIQLTVLAR